MVRRKCGSSSRGCATSIVPVRFSGIEASELINATIYRGCPGGKSTVRSVRTSRGIAAFQGKIKATVLGRSTENNPWREDRRHCLMSQRRAAKVTNLEVRGNLRAGECG